MPQYLADGIGGTVGDSLTTDIGMFGISGSVMYVSSVSGSDTSGYGRNRERPVASLQYAVNQSSVGDIIVLLDDHTEQPGVTILVDKKLVITAEGYSDGKPTASIWGNTSGSDEVLTVTGSDVEIRGVRFRPQLLANGAGNFLGWSGTRGRMVGCYFESGAFDTGPKFALSGDFFAIESTTFISISATAVPGQAFLGAAAGMSQFAMRDCVLSGGGTGWSSANGAMYLQDTTLDVRIEGMSLLLGADIRLASGITGYATVNVATGGGQVRSG